MQVTTQTSLFLVRLAAGIAVGFWGISKLIFVQNWAGPYEFFYGALPLTASAFVYLLGLAQIAVAVAIVIDIFRRPAAWIAAIFSAVGLVASLVGLFRPDNPILANPAPLGIKLVWFFFDPLAILTLFIAVALLPKVQSSSSATMAPPSEE